MATTNTLASAVTTVFTTSTTKNARLFLRARAQENSFTEIKVTKITKRDV